MNLNTGVFDNVLAIDERLQQLEQEVQFMDQQYGFANKQPPFDVEDPSTIPSQVQQPLPQSNQTLKQNKQSKQHDQIQQQTNKSQVGFKQSRYQGLQPVQIDQKSLIAKQIKPQISKEYANTLAIGRPDLSILEQEFENGDKFYEMQYANEDVNIRFRETESQIRHENNILNETLRNEANGFYDSFM